ncbi:MAG: NUDIX hydrolase, partial [Oscillospiraceae bacterium]
MKLFEKCIESETVYKGVVTFKKDTVLLENGKTSKREYMEHPGACCVVPLDDQGNIIFVRQFRYPFGKVFLELPAGKLDKNEDIKTCALRELEEETGYTSDDIKYLGKICPSIAFSNEVIHVYLAENLAEAKQCLDDDEFLEIVKIPYYEAVRLVMDNEVDDAKTTYGILKLMALVGS